MENRIRRYINSSPVRRRRTARHYIIGPDTGPWDSLGEGPVLAILDELAIISAANHCGFSLRMHDLVKNLTRRCPNIDVHWIATVTDDDWNELSRSLYAGMLHRMPDDPIDVPYGYAQSASSTGYVAALASHLLRQQAFDVLLLASSSPGLVLAMRAILDAHHPETKLVTLSIAGSATFRLAKNSPGMVDGEIQIGLDCLTILRDEEF